MPPSSWELPNRMEAYVPQRKLTGYLLSETHAVGKSKARFFRSLGFDETNIEQLQEALVAIAHIGPVKDIVSTSHGTKYVIDGFLKAPQGGSGRIRTVWAIEPGQSDPRFVTAYPLE